MHIEQPGFIVTIIQKNNSIYLFSKLWVKYQWSNQIQNSRSLSCSKFMFLFPYLFLMMLKSYKLCNDSIKYLWK